VKGGAVIAAFLGATLTAGAVRAAPVTSADEVCGPSDDPCIIDSHVEVDSAYPLVFGLRTVRIVPGGKLTGTVSLACGAFEVDVGPGTAWMELAAPVGTAQATITARRACSGDSSTPCVVDSTCADALLGTCSIGDGGIRIAGDLDGKHGPAVLLRAAGDIGVQGEIVAKGSKTRSNGGTVELDSGLGSIELAAVIDAQAGEDVDYGGPGPGGEVRLSAGGNIVVSEPSYVGGISGAFLANAGGDLTVTASIFAQTLPRAWDGAGTISLDADGDIDVVAPAGSPALFLDVRGNSRWSSYGLYAGPGGYAFLDAGEDLTISSNVRLEGDSGKSRGKYVDDLPFSACWYFYAGGAMTLDGRLTSRGKGIHGYGCPLRVEADGGISVGRKARVTTQGMTSGAMYISAGNRSPITIDGRLDARARSALYYGTFYGYGGAIYMTGGDVTVNGRALNGGGSSGNGIFVDACRLRLGPKARLDAAQGRQYFSAAPTEITIGESMIAEPGSKIRGRSDGSHTITYRDTAKPPVLEGKIKPAPTLISNPLLTGCPVCGNLEIDAGETCDDGNVLAGDGCSDLCQLE